MMLEDRFWAKLAPQDPATGCIVWTGTTSRGYGQIWRDGKNIKTHCLAWELKNGPIPKGKCVCHHCDNPSCCNEEHLYLGTHGDNMADKASKGRAPGVKGAKNPWSKLTEADVQEICRRLADGETHRKIAAAFDIDPSTVSKIKRGKSWSHLSNKIKLH